MQSSEPMLRPQFDRWLRERKFNYSTAGRVLGCSRMTVQRYCLPFSDPRRRFPSKGILPRIVEFTGGQITGHDFLPPREMATIERTPADIIGVAA